MLTSSAKNKGRILCKWVKQLILSTFQELKEDDIQVTSSGAGGEDLKLSPMARELLPMQIECKSLTRFSGYAFINQAIHHGPYTAVVVIKQNSKLPLVLIDAETFFRICKLAYGGK
jgi:hypothetical protein